MFLGSYSGSPTQIIYPNVTQIKSPTEFSAGLVAYNDGDVLHRI